jgi:hypothetical protein
MSQAKLLQKVDIGLYNLFKKLTLKLVDRKEIKSFDLRKIYEYIKDVPFEGEYNIFEERIIRELEKNKYY